MRVMGKTYSIAADGASITCLLCGKTSHHPGDVANRYCAACRVFHDTAAAAAEEEADEIIPFDERITGIISDESITRIIERPRPLKVVHGLPAQLFVHKHRPSERRFVPPSAEPNPVINKPKKGGMWTSSYDPHLGSQWVQWCLANKFAGPVFRCWLLQVDQRARVLVIDDVIDLVRILYLYRAKLPEGWPHEPSFETFDWQRLAADFDALHLTDNGATRTRLSIPYHLNAWDCESTLWFRWCFTEVTDLGERTFSLDDDAE